MPSESSIIIWHPTGKWLTDLYQLCSIYIARDGLWRWMGGWLPGCHIYSSVFRTLVAQACRTLWLIPADGHAVFFFVLFLFFCLCLVACSHCNMFACKMIDRNDTTILLYRSYISQPKRSYSLILLIYVLCHLSLCLISRFWLVVYCKWHKNKNLIDWLIDILFQPFEPCMWSLVNGCFI